MPNRRTWAPIIQHAKQIVENAEHPLTLRNLHYQLVSTRPEYRNNRSDYGTLGKMTAQGRRDGVFPRLLDTDRGISRPSHWDSPESLIDSALRSFRLDRQGNQDFRIYIATEKMGTQAQLERLVRDRGIPVVALGGQTGEELVTDVADEIADCELTGDCDKPVIIIYSGDWDPSGLAIPNNFESRLEYRGVKVQMERVGINHDDLANLVSSMNPVKPKDPNFKKFKVHCAELGVEVGQYELEALPVQDLDDRIEDRISRYWDPEAYDRILLAEEEMRDELRDRLGR
jgi:hypothetical protein